MPNTLLREQEAISRTANGGNFWGGVIDAVKQASGGTLAIDGTFTTASGGVSIAPGNIWTAQMDYDGTYWCVNSPIGTWRYYGGRDGSWHLGKNGQHR